MRRSRRGSGFHQELGGSGEDSFVAVVVTKLTGALLFILLLTMVIMALVPKADQVVTQTESSAESSPGLLLNLPERLPEVIAGRPYQYEFSVRGSSTAKLHWSLIEPMPEGLSFDAELGRISGVIDPKTDLESRLITVQVTDGREVLSGQTELVFWNPPESPKYKDLALSGSPKDLTMRSWLSQGFGFALIWLGHISGISILGRLQTEQVQQQSSVETVSVNRFRGYRMVLWLVSVACTGFLVWSLWL
ncbi:MAG: hypothetical protein RJA81_908 [Planctomycetota bacterium]|jgi:hypothetical protein